MMELKKNIKDVKIDTEKSQRETSLEIENLGKISGVTDASITNRIQEIVERISEDSIENLVQMLL